MSYQKNIFFEPIKKVKKRIIYPIKFFRDKIFFNYYLRKNTPVFVYQMGKVGSKSVYKSLCKQYTGVVLHAHYFDSNHTNWKIRRLYRWTIDEKMPLNVISLTREPIGRNVSLFFQSLEKYTGLPYRNTNFSLDELKEIFLNKLANEKALKWFDENIKKNFGIDLYANFFPTCGYAAYSHQNIRILVMRSEICDKEKVKAIKDFLKVHEFNIINRNIGEKKEYALMYKNFKNNVKFPKGYVDKMCKSIYFNHFYGKEYINEVREKWCER